jgi:hypothetical protein
MHEQLDMSRKLLDDIYKVKQIDTHNLPTNVTITGQITEKEKFRAAKQILLGLAILYILTLVAYLIRPNEGSKLIDISHVTFPPLATLILAAYFREKSH